MAADFGPPLRFPGPVTSLTLARDAMATRFELVLFGPHAPALRAAGEEALDEIQRLEAQLSAFRAGSAIADLNTRAQREPVRVEPRLFELLAYAQRLHRETQGAFDITVGPLMQCWGFVRGTGQRPAPTALAEARARVGMDLVQLDPADFTVRFRREGVRLDLGAIGKGYAVEQAMQLLAEAGITTALLHGGTSSIATLGAPPGQEAWPVGIECPPESRPPHAVALTTDPARPATLLALVPLRDASLSVSGVHGKSFSDQGETFGHVLDPRTGWPAARAILAAVVVPSATDADALSTALLTLGPEGGEALAQSRPELKALVVHGSATGPRSVWARGISVV